MAPSGHLQKSQTAVTLQIPRWQAASEVLLVNGCVPEVCRYLIHSFCDDRTNQLEPSGRVGCACCEAFCTVRGAMIETVLTFYQRR